MINEKDSKKLKFIINILYVVALLGIAYIFLKFIFFWVLPFLIAFAVSLLVDPIINLIKNKLKWKRSIASTLTITLFLVIFLSLAGLLSTTLIKEIRNILGNFGNYLDQISTFILTIPTKYGHLFDGKFSAVLEEFVHFIKNYDYTNLISGTFGSGALKYAGSFITSLPSALIFFIVTVVATYFTSVSLPTIKDFVIRQFSDETKELIFSIKYYFVNTIVKYLKSYFVLMMITFAELSVAFLVFDFKPAVTLAFIISIVDILPILGVGTVLIPWSIIEFLLGNPVRGTIILCTYLVITVVRQILEPKIIGDHVGLLPIVTLFCIYVGLQLFGVIGMFLLPISVIIIKNLQENNKIKIWK